MPALTTYGKAKREALSGADPIGAINLVQSDVSPLLNNIDRNTMKKLVPDIQPVLLMRNTINFANMEMKEFKENLDGMIDDSLRMAPIISFPTPLPTTSGPEIYV